MKVKNFNIISGLTLASPLCFHGKYPPVFYARGFILRKVSQL